MNKNEFTNFLKEFRKGISPGRNIFLWYGSSEMLSKLLEDYKITEIDLALIFSEAIGDDFNKINTKKIEFHLDDELNERVISIDRQLIFIIRNAELLHRYNIGLGAFYANFANEKIVAILVLEKYDEKLIREKLPDYAYFEPTDIISFIKQRIEREENILIV